MKIKTVYVCQKCGDTQQKWLGKCPNCEAWNSFVEDAIMEGNKNGSLRKHSSIRKDPIPLLHCNEKEERTLTGIEEFDRVLGGGITEGSTILLSGEPGIGKSTLTLKICEKIAGTKPKVIYISGEESAKQISLRARRLGIKNENISLLNETSLENIIATLQNEKPDFFIIDSIQVIASEEMPSIAGSINQVRYCAESIINYAKEHNVPALIIGHVTKDGNLAGPKVLEHLVDTVLLIEGERFHNLRILRGLKNRYGSTNEIGLFEMEENGMKEVTNASKYFLESRKENAVGSAITATVEGNRALLVEVQALTSLTPFGYPKRAASGFDVNRLQLLLAVIQKHLNINVSTYDVYINITGGYKLSDPAADLAVVMAIISSLRNKPLAPTSIYIGEVGLTGEIRTASQNEKRVNEAKKLGFDDVITTTKELREFAFKNMKNADIKS